MALIDRYLAKTIFVPLLGTLLLAAMLLVLDKILRLFDFVIDAGGPVSVVMNITTPDAESFRRSQSQIAARMGQAMQRGQRNR